MISLIFIVESPSFRVEQQATAWRRDSLVRPPDGLLTYCENRAWRWFRIFADGVVQVHFYEAAGGLPHHRKADGSAWPAPVSLR
jgi:hypothetical protein